VAINHRFSKLSAASAFGLARFFLWIIEGILARAGENDRSARRAVAAACEATQIGILYEKMFDFRSRSRDIKIIGILNCCGYAMHSRRFLSAVGVRGGTVTISAFPNLPHSQ
jgi:hypothetical protein